MFKRSLIIVIFTVFFSFDLMGGNFFISPTEVELGDITWKTEKSFEIKFINRSDKVVHIKKVVSLCSYIKLYRKKLNKVLPGETLILKAKYFGGSLGYFGKVIKIYTDYPGWKEVEITVKGKVVPPEKYPKLELDKKKVDLGEMNFGESKEFVITIKNKGEGDLKLKLYGFNPPKKSDDKPIIIPAGKKGEFYYNFNANKSGRVEKVIWIQSNDPSNPNIPIAVTGKVNEKRPSEGKIDFSVKKAFPVIAFLTGLSFIIYGTIKFFS